IISRDTYIQKISLFIRKPIIKVLTGQRRVGKSYLLYQLMEKIKIDDPSGNIIYINKESMEFDFMTSAQELNDYVIANSKDEQQNYIFIDEIQDIVGFEKALRSLLLDENNDIYITGSNARLLSGELATFLSGRYIEFTIYSLSYWEFLQFHKLNDSAKSYELFAKYGGLPYLINLSLTDDVANEYLKNVYSTIVFRDVISRYHIRNTVFLEKLAQFLSNNIGSLFSAKNISDYLKSQQTAVSVNQVQNYVGYLCNSFLIHRIPRYDIIGKRVFEIGEKYYFENTGIRNIISGYRLPDKAKIWENIVYNHLLYLGFSVKVGYIGNIEVDFVCEKEAERIYVQIALRLDTNNTIEREFGNLLKIQDNFPKIVISEDEFSGNTFEGIQYFPIRRFLLKFCSV
ncbi:hypothetical protein EZS27_035468, partial [termite gut metagenome]